MSFRRLMLFGLFAAFNKNIFSDKQRSHVFCPAVYTLHVFKMDHFILGSSNFPLLSLLNFLVQTYKPRVDAFFLLSSRNDCLWPVILHFIVFEANVVDVIYFSFVYDIFCHAFAIRYGAREVTTFAGFCFRFCCVLSLI